MLDDLAGRVALVTGGATGIGGAISRAYGAALQFWSYPILLILAIGTYRQHQRRLQTAA